MSPLPLPSLRLLLVDDGSIGLGPLIGSQFRAAGQTVALSVETGNAGAIADRDFDALLVALDLGSAESDDRLEQITVGAGSTPVVLISLGVTGAAARTRALRAGAAEVVTVDDVTSARIVDVVTAAARNARGASEFAHAAPPPVPGWLLRTPRIAALALILLGAVVSLGWLIGSTALTSVDPSLPSLKLRAASGFMLVGASLLLLRRPTVIRVRAAAAISGLICGFTLVTLVGLILHRDLGLQAVESLAVGNPGRAAPLTAVAFLCLGLTQLTLEAKHPLLRRVARYRRGRFRQHQPARSPGVALWLRVFSSVLRATMGCPSSDCSGCSSRSSASRHSAPTAGPHVGSQTTHLGPH